MSKLLILFLISLLGMPVTVMSQTIDMTKTAAAEFFNRAPVDVATGLSPVSRLDMIDYFTHGSSVKSENRLGRKCALKSISDNMIVWQDDDSVSTAIVVLPESNTSRPDTLLLVIRTIASPVADSELSYYSSGWQKLSDRSFPRPVLTDWVKPEYKGAIREIADVLPFMFMSAEFEPQKNTLVFTDRTEGYFADGDAPSQLSMLKSQLKYVWDGKRFRQTEE